MLDSVSIYSKVYFCYKKTSKTNKCNLPMPNTELKMYGMAVKLIPFELAPKMRK